MTSRVAIALSFLIFGISASAAPCVSGARTASVLFSNDALAHTLTLTLTNTGTGDVCDPTDILTALYFKYTGPALTPVTAYVGPGSHIYDLSSSTPTVPLAGNYIGAGWDYSPGNPGGFGAAGFNIFGQGNFGCGTGGNPACQNVQGVSYGLLSAGDNLTTGNGGVLGSTHQPLIDNSAIFVFTYNGVFDYPTEVSNIIFQYGTSNSEPELTCQSAGTTCNSAATPEPPALLLSATILGFALWKARRSLPLLT
jgi:hypothetical protein